MVDKKPRQDRFDVQQYEVDARDNPDVVTEVRADDSPFEEVEFLDENGKPIIFDDDE